MKIAIFHNLEKGGALNSLIEPLKHLKKNHKIEIYSFNKNIPIKLIDKFYYFKLNKTNNIFQNLKQILFELRKKSKKIAQKINKKNYDLIIIFPCILIQSPYLLKYIKNKNKVIYFFTEPKREFYESTSFDYWSLKKIITRFIRFPIKYIDKCNCKNAKHIVSNSFYSANNLIKIYKKKSTVIYPGMKPIIPKKIVIKNNKKILSVGLLSKIKGHDFSIQQIKNNSNYLTIIGRKSDETKTIFSLAKRNHVILNIIKTEKNKVKNFAYKKHSIYLANQKKEPFGITTLEAAFYNCFILGKNEGGTPEIIENGINGYLYTNIKESQKIIKKTLNKNKITFYKKNTINWKYTTDKILELYSKISNEPAE